MRTRLGAAIQGAAGDVPKPALSKHHLGQAEARSTKGCSNVTSEYEHAAEWCAERGLKGTFGDPLPPLIADTVKQEIDDNPEAFEARVNDYAYALSMERSERRRRYERGI